MSAKTLPSIEERVAAGAAWLDDHRPGWVERINVETLNLGDSCFCILGQEFGDFNSNAAVVSYEDDVSVAASRGFTVPLADDLAIEAAPLRFRQLTHAWRRLIETRRAES